jgi:hypothetical protein
MVSGSLKTLKSLQPRLGGDVLDLTTVTPRYDGDQSG